MPALSHAEVHCIAAKKFVTGCKHQLSATARLLNAAPAIAFISLSCLVQGPKPSSPHGKPLQGPTPVCASRHVGANPLQARSSRVGCKRTVEQAHASATFCTEITWPRHTFQPPGQFVLSKILPEILAEAASLQPTPSAAVQFCCAWLSSGCASTQR